MIADARCTGCSRPAVSDARHQPAMRLCPLRGNLEDAGPWARLTDALLEQGYGRDSGIVALGGGVAGDLGGFVAATYMRGVPCFQVPTSLLAMLDASVGGKNGVDTPQGKNLIGAFHPPVAVLADPRVLATLPERDYRGGMAEAVKHGRIADEEDSPGWSGRRSACCARDEAASRGS